MSARLTVAAITAVAVAATIAAAQGPPQQPPFRSEANYVRVDVYPTAGGKAVVDLRAEDFEILEDGVPQVVSAFDHITASAVPPASRRADPGTTEGMKQAAAVPRGRVFVVFLDAAHVTSQGSEKIAEPLIRLIDRLLGPEDLIGVMTADMSPSELVLGRRTEMLERGLRTHPEWGRRFDKTKFDEREQRYRECYPTLKHEISAGRQLSELAQSLIDRRKEKITLDALNELVRYLGNLSDVRKTILTITEGWMLFRPDQRLLEPRLHIGEKTQDGKPVTDPVPGTPGIVIRDGSLRMGDRTDYTSALYQCETDRMTLAGLDDDRYFKELIGDANRANASFYTIDPRGLPVFNGDVSVDRPSDVNLPLAYDRAMLRFALDSMRTLAQNTDGVAILNSNDLDRGLRRISDDLTSYYLLGYDSTNSKLDGKFHEIKVRVRRPGVEVRARRGYRSATAAEVAAARTAAAPPVLEPVAVVTAAINALARLDSAARFRIDAVPVPSAGSPDIATVWVSGELIAAASEDWSKGGTVTIELNVGSQSASSELTVVPGQRAFLKAVVLPKPAAPGPLQVRARLAGPSGTLQDSIRVETTGGLLRPVIFRRGPSTGNRLQPAATSQFSRMERVRLEVPLGADAKPGAGRLLDRAAQPLTVPVIVAERTDPETGQRWLTADLTLAALGAGDYAIEMGLIRPAGEHRVISAIRVTR